MHTPTYPVTLTDGRTIQLTVPPKDRDPECYACTPGYALCALHAKAPDMYEFIDLLTHAQALPKSVRERARALLREIEG